MSVSVCVAEMLRQRLDIERSKVRILWVFLRNIFFYSLSIFFFFLFFAGGGGGGGIYSFVWGSSIFVCLIACDMFMATVNRRGSLLLLRMHGMQSVA